MKREEEMKYASKDYVNYLLDKQEYHNENYTEDDIRQAFEKGAEWADEHPKSPWIAVEDNLPEIGEAVFIRTSKSTYGVSWIDYDLDWQGVVAYSPLNVTHWMPIPNLQKEKNESH